MMFSFIVVGVCFIVVTLLLNRILSCWYRERVKFYKHEEVKLANSLKKSMQRQKNSMLKLRRLKSKIRSYEALLPNPSSGDNPKK